MFDIYDPSFHDAFIDLFHDALIDPKRFVLRQMSLLNVFATVEK
jgi:hypothetical protein